MPILVVGPALSLSLWAAVLPWTYAFRTGSVDLHRTAREKASSDKGSADKCRVGRGHSGLDANASEAQCSRCLSSEYECKWCPLTQTCISRGWFGGGSCMTREGHAVADSKVLEEVTCHRHPGPPWLQVMESSYGVYWEKDRQQHIDAKRCMEWVLGWPVTPDPTMPLATEDEAGSWGCMSAIIRDGMLAAIKDRRSMTVTKPHPARSRQNSTEDSLLQETAEVRSSLWWYHSRTEWTPSLCEMILASDKARGNGVCHIRGYAIDEFRELQKAVAQPGRITPELMRSFESGPLITSDTAAGSSGVGTATTRDGLFMVKLGISYKNKEPHQLMELVKGPGSKDGGDEDERTLISKFKANGNSLLNRYYGLFKVRFGTANQYVVVSQSDSYDLGLGIPRQTYELKPHGFADNSAFKEDIGGKLDLTIDQCLDFQLSVKADTTFLNAHNIYDYSIDLTVVEDASSLQCKTVEAPFCMKHKDRLYMVSITNYLMSLQSTWGWSNYDDYGRQMVEFAEKICPTPPLDQIYHDHLRDLLMKHGGSMKEAFNRIDRKGKGYVTREDLKEHFEKVGISTVAAGGLFREMDAFGTGRVTYSRFRHSFERFEV